MVWVPHGDICVPSYLFSLRVFYLFWLFPTEERMIRKNKTDFQARLQLDGSLNSIMRIKMSIPELLTACHIWKPSPSLPKGCKQATKA